MKRCRAIWVSLVVGVVGCGPWAAPSALTSQSPSLTAAPTANDFELRAAWSDYPDETSYTLLENTDVSPGPVLVSGPGGIGAVPGPGWDVITELSANTTSFTHGTIFATTFGLCAYDAHSSEQIVECQVSARAQPKVPDFAEVESMQISQRANDRLRVQWVQSSNTVSSRATISPRGDAVSPVVDDGDQSVTFIGLSPNTPHTITVCVQSEGQRTSGDSTCESTTERTLPLIPLAVSSVAVNQGDPSPTRRTVTFTYENRQANEVVGLSVRLIRNDAIEQSVTRYPSGFGVASYSVTFSGLQPFTAYEAWVAPYNQSGVGTAAGVGFTTPTEVIAQAPAPLSGNSAMLRFNGNAVGAWIVERDSGSGFAELGRILVTSPGPRRVVVQNLSGAQVVRIRWRLAYLTSHSDALVVKPLAAGAPELQSMSIRNLSPSSTGPKRYTAVLLPTVTSRTEYVLQGKVSPTLWQTIVSTGRPVLLPEFTIGQPVTLSGTTSAFYGAFRVCRSTVIRGGGAKLSCSADDDFQTKGLSRF